MALCRSVLLAVSLASAAVSFHACAQTAATPSTFDVASIRVNQASTDGHHHLYNDPAESHFRAVNVSLRALLQYAYNMPETQILGGPAWLGSTMFDIDAKADSALDARLHGMPSDQARLLKRQMVQALLADRFEFKAHEETRQLPVYALVLAKGGIKFKPTQGNGTTIDTGRSRLHIAGSDDTVNLLARSLAEQLGRVVLNQTGMMGRYDLSLRWTPDDVASSGTTPPDAPPGIFTAIQEQLGLALEPTRGAVPVLVVDAVAMPSAN